MNIEISYRDIEKTDAIEGHIRETLEKALGHFGDRLTRIEAHVGDHNGAKKGPADKRCMIEARPAGSDPVAVEAVGEDLYAVVSDAAGKLRRVVTRRFEKSNEVRGG